jgi:hypothetical protein
MEEITKSVTVGTDSGRNIGMFIRETGNGGEQISAFHRSCRYENDRECSEKVFKSEKRRKMTDFKKKHSDIRRGFERRGACHVCA